MILIFFWNFSATRIFYDMNFFLEISVLHSTCRTSTIFVYLRLHYKNKLWTLLKFVVTVKLVCGDYIGEALQRASIFLNVDLKKNTYALRAYIFFSFMIHLLRTKDHMCEFYYSSKSYHVYSLMPVSWSRCHCL